MPNNTRAYLLSTALIMGAFGFATARAEAAVNIEGWVQTGGGPVAQSTVTLWAASANAPTQLGQAETGIDGHFAISADPPAGNDTTLYLVASGGTPAVNKAGDNNPAIALLTVLGNTPPAKVTINEMTTVASIWTHAQFLDGT